MIILYPIVDYHLADVSGIRRMFTSEGLRYHHHNPLVDLLSSPHTGLSGTLQVEPALGRLLLQVQVQGPGGPNSDGPITDGIDNGDADIGLPAISNSRKVQTRFWEYSPRGGSTDGESCRALSLCDGIRQPWCVFPTGQSGDCSIPWLPEARHDNSILSALASMPVS
ncbi:hypothetical protein BO94DRAFT_54259 [Aspergillus sclerotioniger CBS 115572]|uniref:Uncharacterized protein n=1 Tax=Aspergillus sclerotioniger CBS 115572 TaxID=1450535 RepID=A0A317WSZ0_9EURO|nr:hypothetical protein BO94DRAFT_54259 [Aspergillus sclerotioniger CBS 115572]PWY88891.1 hypothetical protein BO94DRAFT_54259 [Aspergillus sclerotioniger CBS 115572]